MYLENSEPSDQEVRYVAVNSKPECRNGVLEAFGSYAAGLDWQKYRLSRAEGAPSVR